MLKPIKVAFIRLSAMGDLIHSASILPLLFSALQSKYEPVFHWYVDEIFCEVLEDSPFVHKLFSIPLKKNIKQKNFKHLFKLYKQLKVESYDVVIDMQGLLKSSILGRILRSKYFVGFDFWSIKEPLASFFYTQKVSISYQKHILLRNAVLSFGAFNLPVPSLENLLCPKGFISADKSIFPILHNGKKVLFLLETSKKNKTYPKESFLKLVMLFNELDIIPFLLTHKKTINPEKNLHFISLCNLTFTQVKALVLQMDLVIGGDTGITHLSWALQRPSITLFGATPAARFNLATPKNRYIHANPRANYAKNDFSIASIHPEDIFTLSKDLLGVES